MTDDRDRRRIAVLTTRGLLLKAMDDPVAMAYLARFEVTPRGLEEKVGEVLDYLERTSEREERAVGGG